MSRQRFDQHWYSFQSRHRRDVHQDYTQQFILPGLRSRLTFYVGESPSNVKCWFIVSSIFGLIWPYSILMEKKLSRYDL